MGAKNTSQNCAQRLTLCTCQHERKNLNNNAHKINRPRPFSILEPTERWLHAVQCVPKHGCLRGGVSSTMCPKWPWRQGLFSKAREIEASTKGNIGGREHGVFDFSKPTYYFLYYCLGGTRAIPAFCTRVHMHACFFWDQREHLTEGKYVWKHLLWVLPFGYVPYYPGFGVPWVYMSQYRHLGHTSYFSCAPKGRRVQNGFLALRTRTNVDNRT